MGKADNRRTFKMKRRRAQAAKKAGIKAKILAGQKPVVAAKASK